MGLLEGVCVCVCVNIVWRHTDGAHWFSFLSSMESRIYLLKWTFLEADCKSETCWEGWSFKDGGIGAGRVDWESGAKEMPLLFLSPVSFLEALVASPEWIFSLSDMGLENHRPSPREQQKCPSLQVPAHRAPCSAFQRLVRDGLIINHPELGGRLWLGSSNNQI